MEKLYRWGELMREELDWVEIALHGFAHLRGEWTIHDKKKIEIQIRATENIFNKIGIPFQRIFKAPFWEWSKETEEVLKDRGYVLAIDRNSPKTHTDIPTYVWSWSIDTPLPEYHTIKGHGHMHGTSNGVNVCYNKLLKLPQDANYKFISEYLEDEK